jgi:hypothetical protein
MAAAEARLAAAPLPPSPADAARSRLAGVAAARAATAEQAALAAALHDAFYVPAATAAAEPPPTLRLLWALYVVARGALLPAGAAPAAARSLLAACLDLLLGATPARAPCLRAPFADAAVFVDRAPDGAARTMRAALATARAAGAPADAALAARLALPLDALVADLVAHTGLAPASAAEAHAAAPLAERPAPASRVYLGLLSAAGAAHPEVAAALDARYVSTVLPRAPLDERAFIAARPGGAARAPAPAAGAAPLAPPPPAAAAAPEVAETLEAAAWLERATAAGRGAPGEAALAAALARCGAGGAAATRLRAAAAELAAAAWPPVSPAPGAPRCRVADAACRAHAAALFLRAVAAMAGAELPRAGPAVVARLLASDAFLRGVFACAACCVAAAISPGAPGGTAAGLARLGATPADLAKLAGPFVRAEPGLPRALKRRLLAAEAAVLERLAWQPGGGLLATLAAAGGGAAAARLPAALGAATPPGGDAAAHALAADFLARALRLGRGRLAALAGALALPPPAAARLAALAAAAAAEAAASASWLLYGRHLDQLLLCCLYGSARAAGASGDDADDAGGRALAATTFRAILAAYRGLPGAEEGTFREVAMAGEAASRALWAPPPPGASPAAPPPPTPADAPADAVAAAVEAEAEAAPAPGEVSDVIAFYNRVFLPAMKPALLRLAAGARGAAPTAAPAAPTPPAVAAAAAVAAPAEPARARSLAQSPIEAARAAARGGGAGPRADSPARLAPGRWQLSGVAAGARLVAPARSPLGKRAPAARAPPARASPPARKRVALGELPVPVSPESAAVFAHFEAAAAAAASAPPEEETARDLAGAFDAAAA